LAFAPLLAKSIALDPSARYATAADMADAVAAIGAQASPKQIGAWVRELGAEFMAKRDRALADESSMASGRNRTIPEATGSVRSSIEAIGTANISQVSQQAASPSQVSVQDSQVSVVDARSRVAMIAAIVVLLIVVAGLAGYVLRDTAPKASVDSAPSAQLAAPSTSGQASHAPDALGTAPMEHLNAREGGSATAATATAPKPKAVFVGAPRPTARPTSSAVDCSTPFYFEGTRKVFKPGCL
jgi:eukaryotic-like serine/threonine-protein kinase